MPFKNFPYMCVNAQNARKHELMITVGIYPPRIHA